MKDEYDKDKNLSDPISTPDEKQVIAREDFLALHLKEPKTETETLRLNATNILKVLGVRVVGMQMAKRANKWLRANGFAAVHRGTVYTVGLVDVPSTSFRVV